MVTHAKTICIMRIENYPWQVWSPLVKFGHYFTLWIKGLTSATTQFVKENSTKPNYHNISTNQTLNV